jgi:hypothetical protein
MNPNDVVSPYTTVPDILTKRAAEKSKDSQMRVFGLFLLLLRLAPVGLIAR